MNEVDAKVGKEQEEWELEPVVVCERLIFECVVQFGVTKDFEEEEWRGEDSNTRHRARGLGDFHLDLVLEELGVFECGLVEYKLVRE